MLDETTFACALLDVDTSSALDEEMLFDSGFIALGTPESFQMKNDEF